MYNSVAFLSILKGFAQSFYLFLFLRLACGEWGSGSLY